jgi:hypothetical protein
MDFCRSRERWTRDGTAPRGGADGPGWTRRPDGAQAPITALWLMSRNAANGGARSTRSRDTATAARIARIASGSSTVAIRWRRPLTLLDQLQRLQQQVRGAVRPRMGQLEEIAPAFY